MWVVEKWIHFSSVDRHWFGCCVAVETFYFLASGPKLTGFLCRGIEIDLILERGSKLTWFQWWGRTSLGFYVRNINWLGFSVGIELDLILYGGQNRLRFCVRAENYFVLIYGSKLIWFLAWGSKLTWFLCAGRKWLDFSVGIDWLSFTRVVEVDLVFVCWTEITWFYLVWASNLTSFLCGWSKLTWFQCRGSNLTWFQCRDQDWLGFGVGVENDLVLVFRSKWTWFYYGDQNRLVFCAGIGIDLVFGWGRKWLGFSV